MGIQQKRYFFLSVLLHGLLFLILVLTANFNSKPFILKKSNQHDVIQAVVLGDSVKSKMLAKVSAPPPPPQPIVKEKAKPLVTSSPPAPIKKDTISLTAQKSRKQREMLAKDLLADIKKHNEKQHQTKQKKLQANFSKTLQEEAEKTLREQLLTEKIKLQAMHSHQMQGIVDKYKSLIRQAISEHWRVPSQANKKLFCELMIRLAPGGAVLDVQITKSSGDRALDSSARTAVLKASPLPVPEDHEAFESFRQFVLKARPENIIAAEA